MATLTQELKMIPHQALVGGARYLATAGLEMSEEMTAYLSEIDRRKLHLELGFKDLQEFFFSELASGPVRPTAKTPRPTVSWP